MDCVACQAPLCMGFFRQEYCSGLPFPFPGDLPNPGIKPRSPTLQVGSLSAEPQRKTKNTGVGSLSLLQYIFLTQESNQGLLRCRWILYQLRYQGRWYDVHGHICYREKIPVTTKERDPKKEELEHWASKDLIHGVKDGIFPLWSMMCDST